MTDERGVFAISLDFELHWGIHDHEPIERCRERLHGTRVAVREMLACFAARDIHVTWATVGLLFNGNAADLRGRRPSSLPAYDDARLSPYGELMTSLEGGEEDCPCHLAPSLIEAIERAPNQELASHTYGHYYCLEPGQTHAQFEADLVEAQRIAGERGQRLETLVFPRNQYDAEHLRIAARTGFGAVRCQQSGWIHEPRRRERETPWLRAMRLADSHVPLSGANTTALEDVRMRDGLVCIPDSRFLRPWTRAGRLTAPLRERRIVSSMRYAARHGELCHLWWHPHNFGVDTPENLGVLERLLDEFGRLRESHGMESLTLAEIATRVRARRGAQSLGRTT